MRIFSALKLIVLFVLLSIPVSAQTGETNPCLQDSAERSRLLKTAEDNQYNIRRIEIVGNTYTSYRAFQKYWEKDFEEGSIFTQELLIKSIKGTNKLKTIKRISLDNIEVRLEKDEIRGLNVIDFSICVEQKKK